MLSEGRMHLRRLTCHLTALLIGCGGTTSVAPQPQPERRSVELSWKASVSEVIGYNIYRGTTPEDRILRS